MRRLATTVHVYDPESHQRVILLAGEEPSAELAKLITAPLVWEDDSDDADDLVEEAPAPEPAPSAPEPAPEPEPTPDPMVKKELAAPAKPARRRKTGDE
ncbi:hypothetical protein ACFYWS_20475 [Streptomyces sp. NPDC002795]|uniref:hypothetical protein n=1 Tax=Streptomyces sp. NPDC002795 TaxID=3364665 RepID=UPI00367A8B8A